MEGEEPSTLDEAEMQPEGSAAIDVGDDVSGGTLDEPRTVDRNDDDEMEEGGPAKDPPYDMVSGKKRSHETQDDGKEPDIGGSAVDVMETVETLADDVETIAGTGTPTAAVRRCLYIHDD